MAKGDPIGRPDAYFSRFQSPYTALQRRGF